MKRIRTLATSCAPRTSEKDASRAAALTEHDPGLSPEKSAKSTLCTPCLDAAALLCSRAPAGMREAARAAWVAIARRRCRVLPGGIGWVATRREPSRAAVLRIYALYVVPPGRRRRRGRGRASEEAPCSLLALVAAGRRAGGIRRLHAPQPPVRAGDIRCVAACGRGGTLCASLLLVVKFLVR